MEALEVDSVLKSMTVLVDTREQPTKQAQKRYDSLTVPFQRQTLSYCDYTFNAVLPSGELIHPEGETVKGSAVIERKASLEELSGNLCQNRDRFEREFKRASEEGAKIYLLIEDSIEKLYAGRYKTGFHKNAFTAALWSVVAKYDITPVFCKAEMSGKIIHDILYRELKHRLERGDYG